MVIQELRTNGLISKILNCLSTHIYSTHPNIEHDMDIVRFTNIINTKQVNNHLMECDPLKITIIDYISRDEPKTKKNLLDRVHGILRLEQYSNKTE